MAKKLVKFQKLNDTKGNEHAYWTFIADKFRKDGISEPAQANPDSLPSTSGMYSLTPAQIEVKTIVDRLMKEAPQFLTARQLEVINLMASGLSQRAVGRKLELSGSTVREYLLAAQKKLQKRFLSIAEER